MPQLSVVVPVFNERDNIPPLLAEIATALRGRVDYEVIYIDDDSSDDSRAVLAEQKSSHPELRVLHHVTRSGQSTAVWNGVREARTCYEEARKCERYYLSATSRESVRHDRYERMTYILMSDGGCGALVRKLAP